MPVSTQEHKHQIGLDFFPSCIVRTAGPKKVENTSTNYQWRITGSKWNRKLVAKPHARVQFCYDLVRSHVYFPEWEPALIKREIQAKVELIYGRHRNIKVTTIWCW